MRTVLKYFSLIALRIFFRKASVIGAEKIPKDGPVLFVLNHNNALMDPSFVLCMAPRRVSFLAKAPLFKTPVVGWMLRVMDSIPVYRKQDEGSNPEQNKETFSTAKRILASGGAIALFPEGVSHSDTKLKPLKTGAARIAIGASPITIVPAGLYYTAKTAFRSSVILFVGDPFEIPKSECEADGEPPVTQVRELTSKIEAALKNVTLQADHSEGLALVSRAERIFRSGEVTASGEKQEALREFELRKLLMEGYKTLRTRFPDKLEEIQSQIFQYEAALEEAGVDPFQLKPLGFARASFARGFLKFFSYLVAAVLLFPCVVIGAIVHFPAYRASDVISTRVAKSELDMLATCKILAAMLLFPLTWALIAITGGLIWGWQAAFAGFLAAPLCGFITLVFLEKFDDLSGRARILRLFFSNPKTFQTLLSERENIRARILSLETLIGTSAEPGPH